MGNNPHHDQQLFLYNALTGSKTQVTLTGNKSGRCSSALSGNGLRLACIDDAQNINLYSGVSGSGGVLTQNGAAADPVFNTDGQSIAYTQNGLVYTSNCPVADIKLGKVASANTALAADPLNYTLVVTNDGPGAANNVIVSDTMPAGVQLNTGLIPDQIDDDNATVASSAAECTGLRIPLVSTVYNYSVVSTLSNYPTMGRPTGKLWQAMSCYSI